MFFRLTNLSILILSLFLIPGIVRADAEGSIELSKVGLNALLTSNGPIAIEVERSEEKFSWKLESNTLVTPDYRSVKETAEGIKPDPTEIKLFKEVKDGKSTDFVRLAVIRQGEENLQLRIYFSDKKKIYFARSSVESPLSLQVQSLSESETQELLKRSIFGRPNLEINKNQRSQYEKILIATESDYRTTILSEKEKSSPNAEMLALLNGVEGIGGRAEFFLVNYQHSWSIPDSYSTPSAKQLAEQFKSLWEKKIRPKIQYNAALLWSNRPESSADSLGFSFTNSLDSEFSYASLITDNLLHAAVVQTDQLALLSGTSERSVWALAYPIERLHFGDIEKARAEADASRFDLLKIFILLAMLVPLSTAGYYYYRRFNTSRNEFLERISEMMAQENEYHKVKTTTSNDSLSTDPDAGTRKKIRKQELTLDEKLSMAGILNEAGRKRFKRTKMLLPIICVITWGLFYLIHFDSLVITYCGFIALNISLLYPSWVINYRMRERKEEILYLLPNFVEQISICLSSSLDVWSSIDQAVEMNIVRDSISPLTVVIVRAANLMRVGLTANEAFVAAGKECGVLELDHVLRFLAQCGTHGGEVSKQIQNLSESALLQHHIEVDKKIKALPVKATFPLFLVFAGFFGLLFAGLATRMMESFVNETPSTQSPSEQPQN
jgi:Flp pilus assembly protein TadB